MQIKFDHEKITKIRESFGLSVYELARKLGTSHQNVANWEAGIGPNIDSLSRLCELFDVTPNYFFAIE